MAKKKVKAKKRVARKPVAMKGASMKCGGHNEMFLMKISIIAFVLFMMTVWPALNNLLMRIHWGWYLAIMVIFGFSAMKKHCM